MFAINSNDMNEINSNTLINTENVFKVFAGPGAGKTHWLINHIKNVLRNSKRLNSTSKIACITYTNIAVEEIQNRLEDNANNIYVSTIHNFLYKYIVKPYGFLLKDTDGKTIVNLRELDGHDEHIPNSKIIFDWKSLNNLFYMKDDKKIYECLIDLDWIFVEDLSLKLKPRNNWKRKVGAKYWIKEDLFQSYKELYWKIGTIHHEDVLYFAYKIITENPEVIDYLSLKFPYLFVDEFQDTNPIQTAIVKLIANNQTTVGVIGDAEQSIYKFQGALRQEFIDFSLPDIENYQIKGNRRSTNSIINVLDSIRTDGIKQTPIRDENGETPIIYIGDKMDILSSFNIEKSKTAILSRNNETVGQVKSQNSNEVGNVWDTSRSMDSSYERQRLIYNSIYASELCLLGQYKDAVRIASKIFYKDQNGEKITKTKKKELAIILIDMLTSQKELNLTKTILDFYNSLFLFLKEAHNIKIGSKITKGKFKDFATNTKYSDLIQALRIKDDTSNIKTIHKAKGAEYENVIVVMDNEELKYILDPINHQEDDDSRIYYVAFSRAKDNLKLILPKALTSNEQDKLEQIGFEII